MPNVAERAVVEGVDDVHGAWWKTNVGEGGHEELLGDGGEGAGKVQQDAGSLLLLE